MSELYRRGAVWWVTFYVAGQRHRLSTDTTNRNQAKQEARRLVEEAEKGTLAIRQQKPKALFAAVTAYLDDKNIRAATRTVALEKERLSIVQKHFGDVRLAAITTDAIQRYQRLRRDKNTAARTINMDVSALLRVLRFCGRLEPLKQQLKTMDIHPLRESNALVGRALTVEEQDRLLKAAESNPEWEHVYCAAVVAACTSLCSIEVRRLRRCDVDLVKQEVSVPYGKNKHRLRTVPLLPEAVKALARMLERLDKLGFTSPDAYLWCACQWNHFDATKPQSRWDAAWHSLREKANLPGLRFHDLRYTIITELAEVGTPDFVIQSIAGQVTRKMVERYSQIRMKAKRRALEQVAAMREEQRQQPEPQNEPETVQ